MANLLVPVVVDYPRIQIRRVPGAPPNYRDDPSLPEEIEANGWMPSGRRSASAMRTVDGSNCPYSGADAALAWTMSTAEIRAPAIRKERR
jgi:hypothetical protein